MLKIQNSEYLDDVEKMTFEINQIKDIKDLVMKLERLRQVTDFETPR